MKKCSNMRSVKNKKNPHKIYEVRVKCSEEKAVIKRISWYDVSSLFSALNPMTFSSTVSKRYKNYQNQTIFQELCKKCIEMRWLFKNFSGKTLQNISLKFADMSRTYAKNVFKYAKFSKISAHFNTFLALSESLTLLYCL